MYRNILDEEPQFEEEHLSPNAVSLLKVCDGMSRVCGWVSLGQAVLRVFVRP